MICSGGSHDVSLGVQLRRITGAKSIEIPDDLYMPVLEASYDMRQRREIMKHVRECLSEESAKRWTRIFTALVLVEAVLLRGDPALALELAHGHHFDLLQKVSLLEQFDARARGIADRDVEPMVRDQAHLLRLSLVRLLEQHSGGEESDEDEPRAEAESCLPCRNMAESGQVIVKLRSRDTLSCGSPGGLSTSPSLSTCTGTTAPGSSAASTASPDLAPASVAAKPAGLSTRLLRSARGLQLVERFKAGMGLSPPSRLQAELTLITESGMSDFPPELFSYVVQASKDSRAAVIAIANHLRTRCLGELASTPWQRMYAGLKLVEHVMQRGSPLLFSEGVAQEVDFNLARQIWTLQWIEFPHNVKVQRLLRKTATSIWNQMRQNEFDAGVGAEVVQQEALDDSFGDLHAWLEAGSANASGDHDRSSRSSARSSGVASLSDDQVLVVDFCVRADEGDECRTLPSSSSSDGEAEVFFTPTLTPANFHPPLAA